MIKIIFTIAVRNIIKNKKRSLLIGLAVFVSCTILLVSGALSSGAGKQLAERYRNYLAGDVVVSWANVKEIDPSDAGRLLFSEFDGKKQARNIEAIRAISDFCIKRSFEIEKIITPLRVFGMLDTGQFIAFGMIYGVSDSELEFLHEKRIFNQSRGESILDYDDYTVCISDEMADTNHIAIGDWITLDCQTPSGYVNSIEFNVVGTYRNSAPWDNTTIYITDKNARELFQWDPSLFSQARIYLKDRQQAKAFAAELDSVLVSAYGVLCAEPAEQSGSFYLTFADSLKSIFTFFVFFLLFIIAIGIRSTVRMNVFQRMSEFGTLRSIGFGRPSNFFIIVFEVFALTLASLFVALAVTLLLVLITSHSGIFVGNGVLTSLLGGEYIYPELDIADTLFAITLVAIFSLLAPAKPALRLCIQKITDLLAKNQKNLFAAVYGIKLMINRFKSPSRKK
jgi:ABC-type lipoprotein release transport system permease subunit